MTKEQAQQVIVELMNQALASYPPIARSAVAAQAKTALDTIFPVEDKPKEG